MEPLVVIFGSTGTGKSDLAVELATQFNGEVINADAMQMYEGLPVITNQISPEEQRGVPHHLIGNIGLRQDPWTVHEFRREASRIISEIRGRGKLPIVVGGSAYYIDGLLFDDRLPKDELPDETNSVPRDELLAKFPILFEPADVMLKKLQEVDPVMAYKWHPKDARKIRNSLLIYLTTGRRASDIYAEQQSRKASKAADGTPHAHTPWNVLLFWLYAHRDPLNKRLDARVNKMLSRGLLDEISGVYDDYRARLDSGESVDRARGIVQSIGFWQFEPYLRALKDKSLEDGRDLVKLKAAGVKDTKTATRRYAKYQVKWLTMKTVLSLQGEKLLNRLFLLDATDVGAWHDQVARKGIELTRAFIAGEQLPQPVDVSETAREVLTSTVERSNRQQTPCNKTCELCDKTFVTEREWQEHINSNRHQASVKHAKRLSLVSYDARKTALVSAQPDPPPQSNAILDEPCAAKEAT
ncbi:IPP transferase-domain-containing protein [Podospora conica]|nr:IPP transferase-domain-containing protein [Schizothecium conicum]